MKKTISAVLSVMLIAFTLCSCSSKPNAEMTEANITKTVDTAFEALKNFDTETLEKYVDSTTLNVIMSYAENHEQFKKLGIAIFSNLTYEIKNIDVENKTVTVSVLNKDLYEAASNFTNKLLNSYSTFQLLQRLSDDNWLDQNLAALTKSIESAEMEIASAEITLNITQSSENLILTFNEQAEDEVSGGALRAIKGTIGG